MKLSTVILFALTLSAHPPLAQQLVTSTMAAHPELQKLGLHAIPPGQREDTVIACSVPTKIGKISSPGDLLVEQTGKPTVKKVDAGSFYDLALPLSGSTGERIGMVVMEMRFSGATDEQDALTKAAVIRDQLQSGIPGLASLFGTGATPLTLINTTALPDITGDFDHFAVDLARNRLFVSAEEHHSIEIFDLKTGAHLRSAGNVATPHTIAYVPEKDELLVADGGDASVRILAGEDLHPAGRIPLEPGPDAALYDPATRLFYVGNGGRGAHQPFSFLSVISADEHKEIRKIRLESSNIEAMALSRDANLLYANLRDKQQVALVDLTHGEAKQVWTVPGLNLNTPLALDSIHNRLFIAGRKPGKLFVIDTGSGRTIATLDCVNTADDMSFDPKRRRIYVSGAEGLSVYHQDSPDQYSLVSQFPTQQGKTSIYVPSVEQFYVIHTKTDAGPAGLQIYRVND